MERFLRPALAGGSVLALAFAVICWVEAGWTASTSPAADTLVTYLFLGAVAAAIGASTLWVAYSGELGATVGGAITLLLFYVVLAGSLFVLSGEERSPSLGVWAFLSMLAALALVVVIWGMRRYPIRDTRPLPVPVRVSFAGYSVILAVVGMAILLRVPDIFPLPLSLINSVLIGSFFVGAACYFAYPLRRPIWGNATGQLWAFLVYDLALIVPFLLQFGHVAPGHLASLIVNTAVLIYSGAFSVSYLLNRFAPSVRRRRLHRARTRSSVGVERGQRAFKEVTSG